MDRQSSDEDLSESCETSQNDKKCLSVVIPLFHFPSFLTNMITLLGFESSQWQSFLTRNHEKLQRMRIYSETSTYAFLILPVTVVKSDASLMG